jgi:hypothetical protein
MATKSLKVRRGTRNRSSKGALVKGVSAWLPIDLLEEATFKQGLQEITRGYSGIYPLYKQETLYHIGHTKNKLKGKWDSFAIFRVGRVRYLKDIESLLLRATRPPGNSVSGHFHRDADLGIREKESRRFSPLTAVRQRVSSSRCRISTGPCRKNTLSLEATIPHRAS